MVYDLDLKRRSYGHLIESNFAFERVNSALCEIAFVSIFQKACFRSLPKILVRKCTGMRTLCEIRTTPFRKLLGTFRLLSEVHFMHTVSRFKAWEVRSP